MIDLDTGPVEGKLGVVEDRGELGSGRAEIPALEFADLGLGDPSFVVGDEPDSDIAAATMSAAAATHRTVKRTRSTRMVSPHGAWVETLVTSLHHPFQFRSSEGSFSCSAA